MRAALRLLLLTQGRAEQAWEQREEVSHELLCNDDDKTHACQLVAAGVRQIQVRCPVPPA